MPAPHDEQPACEMPGYDTLIAAADLHAHLSDPTRLGSDWLIVDCRFDLAAPQAGEAAWRESRLPGAIHAHLDRDLSGPRTPATGRHPLPEPGHFAATLGRWGVTPTTQIIAYDADSGAYAARLWWLLRWVGHRKVAVLDGGLKAWQAAGLPLDTGPDTPHPNVRSSARLPARDTHDYPVRPDRDAWMDAREVAGILEHADWQLLDARAPERFAGTIEPIDPIAGHVPGAVNHPFATSLKPDACFAPAAVLRRRFEDSQRGIDDDHTIVMCGSGVTACHLLLALHVAGKPGARLYAGSWSEWIRDPSRPVAKGPGTATPAVLPAS